MNEYARVLITIQMQNDFENAETCFTVTMTDKKAKYLLDEIRGKSTILGDAIYETIHDIAKANAYISTTGDGWEESCDNANGGIDVSWAFHLDAKTIRDRAPQKFMDCCTDLLQCGLSDPSTEHDFIQSVYDLFT